MQYSGELVFESNYLNDASTRSLEFERAASAAQEYALIRQAQKGDLAAYNELVLIYQDLVYRQALWMLKEVEAAEDAAQESFIKAFHKLSTFQLGKPFRPWLLRITSNHCLDMLRKAKRHPSLPLEPETPEGGETAVLWLRDPAETPEQAVERVEREARITRAIQRLSPEYRTVVVLVDLQELDYAEVSGILGVPLGTMKSRLFRARQQLRMALQWAF